MKVSWFAAALALTLAACATPEKPAPAATTSTLFKTAWTAVNLNGEDVPNGAVISADFGDKRVTGTAGCNRYFAGYTESAPKLEITGLGSTKMACVGPAMARETTYLSILGEAASFEQTDRGGLIVTGKDGRKITFMQAGS